MNPWISQAVAANRIAEITHSNRKPTGSNPPRVVAIFRGASSNRSGQTKRVPNKEITREQTRAIGKLTMSTPSGIRLTRIRIRALTGHCSIQTKDWDMAKAQAVVNLDKAKGDDNVPRYLR